MATGADGSVSGTKRRKWPWLVPGVPIFLGVLFVVTVFTGFPGLRPSLNSLNTVAAKINSCAPDAASVDWVRGVVNTMGEPIEPGKELTASERKMVGINGKVGLLCSAGPVQGVPPAGAPEEGERPRLTANG